MVVGQHLEDGRSRLHFPAVGTLSVLFGQSKIEEMDFRRPVVIVGAHWRIEWVNVTAELGHILVERPLIVNAERVDEAIIEDGRDELVKADKFLAVWMGDSSRIARPRHHKAEIDGQLTSRAVSPVQILEHLFRRHGLGRFLMRHYYTL